MAVAPRTFPAYRANTPVHSARTLVAHSAEPARWWIVIGDQGPACRRESRWAVALVVWHEETKAYSWHGFRGYATEEQATQSTDRRVRAMRLRMNRCWYADKLGDGKPVTNCSISYA